MLIGFGCQIPSGLIQTGGHFLTIQKSKRRREVFFMPPFSFFEQFS